jgi:hypothetical protein
LFFSFYPIFCSNNFETLPLIFGVNILDTPSLNF